MTVGEREAPGNHHTGVERHRLRIRTIAVSFRAAVTSAHHDLDTTGTERDALIEVWRAWSLDILERYRSEILALQPAPADDVLRELIGELDAAVESVRTT